MKNTPNIASVRLARAETRNAPEPVAWVHGHREHPFVFIVGRGRSGTTLLRAMLSSNPQLAIPPESHFVVPMCQMNFGQGDGFDQVRFGDELIRRKDFDPWGLSEQEVRAAIARAVDAPSAIRHIYRTYADHQAKPLYGDKTPNHVVHLKALSTWFPEARFVHIIRDGRDVALSYLSIQAGPNSVEEAAAYWDRFVRRGRRDGRPLGPGRYLEIRYEELVLQPEQRLRDVCAFLGLTYSRSMTEYWKVGHAWVPGARHHVNLSRPPTRGIRDWRNEMSDEQLATFEAVAGPLLEELGYPLAVRVSAPRRMARLVRAQAMVQQRRLVRRLLHRSWHSPTPRGA